ncbi:MAG TPA: ABC transporter permease [Tepidisphaeraceae bacterium]|nr:ABC transporter permease [Tepidisphaeraceae bacterium]
MTRLFRDIFPPVVVLLAVIAATELTVARGWIAPYLVPRPTQILAATVENARELFTATASTTTAAMAGFLLSACVGVSLAIVLSAGGWVQRAFYPYAVFFQTVPIIAIAPLLVIWFGFDARAVIASSFIVSVFPVIANTLTGLRSTDPALRDLFRLYGAGPVASLCKLRIPFAAPSIFTGLRVAAGLAVIGTIVGEFIVGTGLGGLIVVARREQRVDKVFAILLLSAALGIVLFTLVNTAGRLVMRRWHASEIE